MPDLDILLINPPFSMPDKPCISIPVLAGYLKQRGFQVGGLDLNNLFYRRLLSPENLSQCMDWAKQRFLELNGQSSLAFIEMEEYLSLFFLIQTVFPRWKELKSLYKNRERRNTENFLLFRYAALLASAPFFPECLEFTLNTGYVRYRSPFHKFSSHDIYNSLFSNSMFDESLNDLLKQRITDINTLSVGLSVTFPDQILPALKCAQIIKGLRPDIHITVGGSFVSVHMRKFKEKRLFRFIDSIILDDGERPLELLLTKLIHKKDIGSDIPGIMYMKGRAIRAVAPEEPLPSADLPVPDYTIFPLDEYLIKRERMALLFRLSRGCIWAKCAFCRSRHSIIKDYRQPNSYFLYEHLKNLAASTGIGIFHFTDNAASPMILEAISRQIEKDDLSIDWVVNLRFSPKLITERLRRYKGAGCRHIYFGLESCTPRLLRLMKKGISLELVESCLVRCAEIGIPVTVYMIVGFPTETEAEARTSYKRVQRFKERGLVKNCIYNTFELVHDSPISANPEAFQIQNIKRPPHLDLAPPLTQFQSSGMSRERARQLCKEFICQSSELSDLLPSPLQRVADLEQIRSFNEEELPINFSLREITQRLMQFDTDLSKVDSNRHVGALANVRVYRKRT